METGLAKLVIDGQEIAKKKLYGFISMDKTGTVSPLNGGDH
ncbi:MAG TPA: hypothetical protein VFC41_01120 [Anaerovoracaceae bacterium]|nr:hypothetical protein [Anaerovoracaceae bacterium]